MEKELWHFTWPVRMLRSGILQIRKKCQNPDDLRILALFSDLQNSISKYLKITSKVFLFFRAVAVQRICVRAPRWQKRRHFSWPVRVLQSGISQIRKSAKILGISRFWNFFRICEIPLLSPLTGQVKCHSFCRAVKSGVLFHYFRGTYKWNFSNLKKVPESWRSQDSGTFFRFSKFHF